MSFSYDGFNRCVKRTVNGVPIYLCYAGWNLIEERSGNGNVLATYIHGANTDEILTKSDANGAIYYHQDALGNVTHLTDSSGNVIEQYRYDAYGHPTISDTQGSLLAMSAFGNRFLFTGREWLEQAHLYDYRNRVYSAELGRFLQTDPLRFDAGDVNFYRYVANNPVNLFDPSGLVVPVLPAAIVIGGATVGHIAAIASVQANQTAGDHAYIKTPLTSLATLLSGAGTAITSMSAGDGATFQVHVWTDENGGHSEWVIMPDNCGV